MNLIYEGKKKQLFLLPGDEKQYLLMKYKVQPGHEENCKKGILLSEYYFRKAEEKGIDTHLAAVYSNKLTMKIKKAKLFGKGIEFTCRYKSEGNFYRRFSDYVKKGHDLGGIVEANVKSVKRGNPPITLNTMLLLKIMTEEEYSSCVLKVKKVAELMKEDLLNKGLTLYDIKFELGKINENIVLIDEITSESMTVYENGVLVRADELYNKLI